MESARGDAIILMDGDQQDPPSVAREMVEKWRRGATVVVARRARRREAEWLQRSRRAFYRILSALAEFPVDLDVGDFALFERRVRDTILQSNQVFPFLRLHRSYAGFEVQSVDYVRPERKYGYSTNSLLANLRWALLGFVSSGTRPLRWGATFLALTALCYMALPSLWFMPMMGVVVSLILMLTYVGFAWPRWVKRPLYVRAEYIYNGERHSS
jgi:dolichol-phosphate mannosyltransferase